MGDVVREYGRIAALFAAAAFLLSLLIGLLTRNPFSVALLRAFLFAIVFAGLGGGVKAAVKRWLPEVGGASGSGRAAAESEGARHAVDIVLPGEAYGSEGLGEGSGAEDEAAELSEEPAEMTEEIGDAGAVEELENSGEDSLDGDDQAGQTVPPAGTPTPRQGARARGKAAEEDLPTAAISAAERDGLPDISGLGGTSASGGSPLPPAGGGGSSPYRTPGGGRLGQGGKPEDALRGSLGNEDPESLAKAIRTVLKRDEKG